MPGTHRCTSCVAYGRKWVSQRCCHAGRAGKTKPHSCGLPFRTAAPRCMQPSCVEPLCVLTTHHEVVSGSRQQGKMDACGLSHAKQLEACGTHAVNTQRLKCYTTQTNKHTPLGTGSLAQQRTQGRLTGCPHVVCAGQTPCGACCIEQNSRTHTAEHLPCKRHEGPCRWPWVMPPPPAAADPGQTPCSSWLQSVK